MKRVLKGFKILDITDKKDLLKLGFDKHTLPLIDLGFDILLKEVDIEDGIHSLERLWDRYRIYIDGDRLKNIAERHGLIFKSVTRYMVERKI